ncbi:bifunctional 2-C-methyl-D-erythritol 4-phosphate cytidylyltransferase/2-C-methyl-D-erythritol 2,4-cyclodiphosphate synthase [Sphingomonas sp.]|jgi:2-C-methyl-D-erythritol 4-phosphate cytidylyltransferase/2-C-methyl-D-erythritol 2,4-cyclodiphosphate synthase|uniref:bifunctional 2-C-methyl-D-erythritol 4-phosphate cytidylyltransferase/2-C-methyl-D-erythritol 2,4-cyclodiphosphate synthase n=1 Tax=Sphingomonas sp. TaxID=28214 RepID=UPI002E33E6CD|nr:bifunctional 2-C-methyl-D-erythritol 4-phosphate cytidylyltransferase/2-C-methyl-D-erythritol 2,4-cyclodiphosphate synthase [Sphingomonas sp.]HEX4693748.1 bifunctional 2-C-methyl-D-erythritol 4-phosphate cytidylyltransferase/2-C-methyl-D-erythritol 2,4-cyclodiphosphate synthase [Sphingomonas sp.]
MGSMDTVALIVAAGQGARAGGDVPKQFQLLAGQPLVEHARRAFAAHPAIARVVTVVAAGQEALVAGETVVGGATRRESVRNGLEGIGAADRVLIHDAARPLIPAGIVDRLLIALDGAKGAVPALPVADTLARGGGAMLLDTVDRSALVRVQTPQAFDFAAILAAHRAWPDGEEATDEAQILRRAGHDVAVVPGDPLLDKITYPGDLALAEARLGAGMRVRTAMGFDVHRLVEGEELWLGGILIPHDKGLSGHSDADVALHAITDAVLGTIAAGDIGTHFPPSDPQWRGAESGQFLRHAASLVAAKDGFIDFVDLTIICEAPKIGPWREAIRGRVADLLGLALDQISVKATTTEGLGFTGRGEGIAAQAIVTVRL